MFTLLTFAGAIFPFACAVKVEAALVLLEVSAESVVVGATVIDDAMLGVQHRTVASKNADMTETRTRELLQDWKWHYQSFYSG